jgi:hypothetical protein
MPNRCANRARAFLVSLVMVGTAAACVGALPDFNEAPEDAGAGDAAGPRVDAALSRDGASSDARAESDAVADAHHDAAPDAAPNDAGKDAAPPGDPCAHVAAVDRGAYCGTSRQHGFTGGVPSTLYHCDSSATTSTTPCPNGCHMNGPDTNDACVVNPCTAVADGTYCGQSSLGGFAGGQIDWLYTCKAHALAGHTACAHVCQVSATGTTDSCK